MPNILQVAESSARRGRRPAPPIFYLSTTYNVSAGSSVSMGSSVSLSIENEAIRGHLTNLETLHEHVSFDFPS